MWAMSEESMLPNVPRSPLKIIPAARPSLLMAAARSFLARKSSGSLKDKEKYVAGIDPNRRGTDPDILLELSCAVTHEEHLGIPVTVVRPRSFSRGPSLIYFHGGAYVGPLDPVHWAIVRNMVRLTGATVYVPDYPLAPEHTASEVLPQMFEFLRGIVDKHGATSLMGDSAGAGMAIAMALMTKEQNLTGINSLVAVCPWVDVRMKNPQIDLVLPLDPYLAVPGLQAAGEMWASEMGVDHPLISPVRAELAGLPPTLTIVGSYDILGPDGILFAEYLADSGTEAALLVQEQGFHVYLGATFTREAKVAFKAAAQWILEHDED